jgi:hypothetical protein
LLLPSTSAQIVTSSNSAHPTTITVPTMGQESTVTLPDVGEATGSIVVTNSSAGVQTIVDDITFLNEVIAPLVSTNNLNITTGHITFNSTNTTQTGPIVAAAQFAEPCTLGFNDPGQSFAYIPTSLNITPTLPITADNNLSSAMPSGPTFLGSNTSLVPINMSLLASTITVLYTIPFTSYGSLIGSCTLCTDGGAPSTVTLYASPDGGTTLYKLASSVGTTDGSVSLSANGMIFLPGDSIVLEGTAAVPTVQCLIKTWPISTSPIVPVVFRTPGLPIGTTTLYTCPANTIAMCSLPDGNTSLVGSSGSGIKMYVNTGGSMTPLINFAGALVYGTTPTTNTLVTVTTYGCLTAGQTITVALGAAASGSVQIWFSMQQLPSSFA